MRSRRKVEQQAANYNRKASLQDDYYAQDSLKMHLEQFQDCYLRGLKSCPSPRYRWLDMLYEWLFHEQCMMLLMSDGMFANMERHQLCVVRRVRRANAMVSLLQG